MTATRDPLARRTAGGHGRSPRWTAAEARRRSRGRHGAARFVTGWDDDAAVDVGARADTPWPGLVETLTASGTPLLVVTGDRDVLITHESERTAHDAGARVDRVPGAGRCVRRDNLPGSLAAVDGFLAEHAR